MKRIISFLLSVIIVFSFPSSANAKYEIAGRNCKKLGSFRTVGDTTYVCVSVSKVRKTWIVFSVATTTTTTTTAASAPLGSFNNPVPLGMNVTYGNRLSMTVHGTNYDVMNFVCSSNMFNDGCDAYSRSPDPASPYRWIRVDLTVQNVGTGLIDIFWEYSWSAVINGMHYGENKTPASIEELSDVEFLPGSTVTTSAYLLVPKTAGTSNFMFAFRSDGSSWSYFRA